MITLIHDLVIDVSLTNYALMVDKHKQDKKGNHLYDTLGYYANLERAIIGARDYYIRKCLSEGVRTLDEAVEIVRQINTEFSDLLSREIGR